MSDSQAKVVPHYALPNTSSVLGPYANIESDMIKNAFNRGNFGLIKSLPNQLKANHLLESRANHIDSNITSGYDVKPHGSYKKIARFGVFSDFEYMPSEYDLQDQLQAEETRELRDKILEVHQDDPFIAMGRVQNDKHRAPYEHKTDPFSRADDMEKRQNLLKQSRIMQGAFVPTGNAKKSRDGNRSHLPDIIATMGSELDEDWEGTDFDLYVDEDDLVIVSFQRDTIDSEKGLQAYMNMLIKRLPVISKYGFSKVIELWNHAPDDGPVLYYALKPSWVSRKITS